MKKELHRMFFNTLLVAVLIATNGSGLNSRAVFHGMEFKPMLVGEANSSFFIF